MQRACAHLGLCFSATMSHQRLRLQPNGAPDRAHAPSDHGGPGPRVCATPPPPAGGLLSPRGLAGAEPAWRPAGASSVPRPGEQRSSRKTLVPGTNL